MQLHHETPCPPALCWWLRFRCALRRALFANAVHFRALLGRDICEVVCTVALVGWLLAFTCSCHPATYARLCSDVLLRVLPPKEERLSSSEFTYECYDWKYFWEKYL